EFRRVLFRSWTSTSGNATVLPGDPTTGLIDPTACPRAHPNANRPGQPACRSVPPRAGSHHREKPHRGLDGSVVGDLRGLVDELRDVPECPLRHGGPGDDVGCGRV